MRDLTGESLADQLSRERLLDMEARLGPVRRQAFAVLALALIAAGPWVGFEFLVPLFVALAGFAIADRRLRRSPRPERWAAGWALAPLIIAISAALTGAAESPALMWLALPVTTLGALRAARRAARRCVHDRPPAGGHRRAGSDRTLFPQTRNSVRTARSRPLDCTLVLVWSTNVQYPPASAPGSHEISRGERPRRPTQPKFVP
jgi:hypothetical protein